MNNSGVFSPSLSSLPPPRYYGRVRCCRSYRSVTVLLLKFCSIYYSVLEVNAWMPSMNSVEESRRFFLDLSSSLQKNAQEISIELVRLPDDLPSIRTCRATVDFAYRGAPNDLLNSQRSFLEASALGAQFDQSRNPFECIECIVARRGKEVLATADCRFRGNRWLISNVFVRPSERGKGLGRRIMLEGVDQLLSAPTGVSSVQISKDEKGTSLFSHDVCLAVYTANEAAIKLYESCGFEPDGVLHKLVRRIACLTGANLMVNMRKQGRQATPTYQRSITPVLDLPPQL